MEIHELPSARGCTYVVPSCDYALALAAGQSFADDEMRVARKLGVTDAEIENLRHQVLKVLAEGPLGPDELRSRTGDAARSLGPEGTKKGITTTLPVALGLLQAAGEIRRVPLNGRIDQQRYRYAAWNIRPQGSFTDLARRYFHWIGPATIAEFQTFSGLSAKLAKEAVEPLKLVAATGGRLLLPEDHEAFERFKTPRHPHYSLVSSLDGIAHLRRDVKSLLATEGQETHFFEARGALTDLPNHAIIDRGRVAGLWEFDASAGRIVWAAFGTRDSEMEEAVRKTETFIQEDLGDARSFSLDSPAKRAPRVAALRKAASA
jgi:hypothetical protein